MKTGKIIAVLLALILLATFIPVSSAAVPSGTLYEATKNGGTPVWSQASSNSKQSHKLDKGKPVTITETKTNSAGNLWGKTVNGTWIYMGNLKKSGKSLPVTGEYKTASDNVPLRYTPASGGKIQKYLKKGVTVKITKTYANHAGNYWGTTSDGYEIYMGNLTKSKTHVHTAAACGPMRTEYYSRDDAYHVKTTWYDNLCSCGAVLSTEATVEPVKHDYQNDSTDECTVCGHLRLHQCLTELLFITAKDTVPLWSEPTSNSTRKSEISKKGSRVYIKARLVNRYGNHWGLTTDGQYVFMDNLVYDLDAQLGVSSGQLIVGKQVSTEFAAAMFFDNEKGGGIWDLKVSMKPGRSYQVKIGDTIETLTGEEIGNIHYGFVGRILFDKNTLLWGGGVLPGISGDSLFEKIDNCLNYYCDTKEDVNSVKRGMDYFDTGVWK